MVTYLVESAHKLLMGTFFRLVRRRVLTVSKCE